MVKQSRKFWQAIKISTSAFILWQTICRNDTFLADWRLADWLHWLKQTRPGIASLMKQRWFVATRRCWLTLNWRLLANHIIPTTQKSEHTQMSSKIFVDHIWSSRNDPDRRQCTEPIWRVKRQSELLLHVAHSPLDFDYLPIWKIPCMDVVFSLWESFL